MPSKPLISAEELTAKLDGLCVLDARSGKDAYALYQASHVRGALYVDLERDLSEPPDDAAEGGRHPLPSLSTWRACLGSWGIHPETQIAIYDNHYGANAAARCWWMLRSIGHEYVSVVDGGWEAIAGAEIPLDAELPSVTPCEVYPASIRAWPSVDADFVERIRLAEDWTLIDARAPDRFKGEQEPIDPVAGHIPGAFSLYWKEQLGEGGHFLAPAELDKLYKERLGEIASDRVVVHCGSGVTACHLLLGMASCGYESAALYIGSWSEWCRQERPRDPD